MWWYGGKAAARPSGGGSGGGGGGCCGTGTKADFLGLEWPPFMLRSVGSIFDLLSLLSLGHSSL